MIPATSTTDGETGVPAGRPPSPPGRSRTLRVRFERWIPVVDSQHENPPRHVVLLPGIANGLGYLGELGGLVALFAFRLAPGGLATDQRFAGNPGGQARGRRGRLWRLRMGRHVQSRLRGLSGHQVAVAVDDLVRVAAEAQQLAAGQGVRLGVVAVVRAAIMTCDGGAVEDAMAVSEPAPCWRHRSPPGPASPSG